MYRQPDQLDLLNWVDQEGRCLQMLLVQKGSRCHSVQNLLDQVDPV